MPQAPAPAVRDCSYGPNSSQRFDVYPAAQSSGRPVPLVVLIHGGRDGKHARDFARRWLPGQPGRLELARRLSPTNYDTDEGPTLCAVHSVHDNVPFGQSEGLVMKWQEAKRRAKLLKLSQGHAAPFKDDPAIFGEIFRFLERDRGIE